MMLLFQLNVMELAFNPKNYPDKVHGIDNVSKLKNS